MARIMIENLFKKTFVVADYNKTLLRHFKDNYIDWMHACGGKGRCTTCKLIVLEGAGYFGDLTGAEEQYLRQGELKPRERLACQAKIRGNISLLVPQECHLPHITYSDEPPH